MARMGEVDEVSFQFLLCRSSPRILDARARRSRRLGTHGGAGAPRGVELVTRFELGPFLSALAGPFLPSVSLWLDPADDPPWLGHRMPLHPGGPTVAVVRSGLPLQALLGEATSR